LARAATWQLGSGSMPSQTTTDTARQTVLGMRGARERVGMWVAWVLLRPRLARLIMALLQMWWLTLWGGRMRTHGGSQRSRRKEGAGEQRG
jgi:hypothetical protein